MIPRGRLVLAVLLVLLLPGCATITQDVVETKDRVIAFTRADVQRGLEIATANGDQAAINCSTTLAKHLPEGGTAVLAPVGPYSTFIKLRGLRRKVDAGVDEAVHLACAPLLVDAEHTILRLGLMTR